ncbi:MAG TPA: ribosome biogenesis GTP-binding protein YihA/YsxC, partial [Longimicrobiales bacterium]|nr:ribosome biogenesis GTP-binding protein YihA/YsxC [Longimicrobiales bacterium]
MDTGSEVAVAGRSNAGKSSAINVLTERRSLARTSKTPGQTQLINFFELKPGQRLVDLPGYGFAKVPARIRAHWQELVGGYLETRNSLMGLLLIVDARRGLNDDDRGLIGWATQRGRRVHLLLSKSDKLSRNEARRVLAGVRSELPMQASAQLFSAVSKEGAEEGQEALDALLGNKKPATASVSDRRCFVRLRTLFCRLPKTRLGLHRHFQVHRPADVVARVPDAAGSGAAAMPGTRL